MNTSCYDIAGATELSIIKEDLANRIIEIDNLNDIIYSQDLEITKLKQEIARNVAKIN